MKADKYIIIERTLDSGFKQQYLCTLEEPHERIMPIYKYCTWLNDKQIVEHKHLTLYTRTAPYKRTIANPTEIEEALRDRDAFFNYSANINDF